MKLTGVLHTGFTVRDIERSIAFYRDVLGMQLVHRQEGVKDIVTGSRYYTHQGHDPGEHGPIVLYWDEIKRHPGREPELVRHLIAHDVSIGTQFVVRNVAGGGRSDIVVANKKGVCVLEQQSPIAD